MYRSDTEMKVSIEKLQMIGRARQRMTIVGKHFFFKHDWQQCYNPIIESQCVIWSRANWKFDRSTESALSKCAGGEFDL